MNIMVIGGGGREHAIVKKLKENADIGIIYCLPGNGGIAQDAVCVDIGAKEIDRIVNFAIKNRIDYAVVAPDDPLVMGLVDELESIGIPSFGPNKRAAIIEGSKAFAKDLMHRYGIPTADYKIFNSPEDAKNYLATSKYPIVIKADGLALGKGVVIAKTRGEAEEDVNSIMVNKKFGDSGNEIVIEEFLEGPEVSVLTFTDGNTIVPMVSSMDHKRAKDGDEGLNTGGMGTIAPNPYYTEAVAERCMNEIFIPTIKAMNAEGRTFKGCLYFGLMITADGPKVIEYNCRFGDPETQVVLPLLKSDLFTIMQAVTNGKLSETKVEFLEGKSACCVIVASEGYPGEYEKGYLIVLPKTRNDTTIYIAGAKVDSGKLYTSGGRILGVTAVEDTLEKAIGMAYTITSKIKIENGYYRKDIGRRALEALKEN